ncbi:hypothetical protein HRbin15_01150 [bacterium HR15]|nr:hypothetical protein HRbin15_01150 [bacterium HR15]
MMRRAMQMTKWLLMAVGVAGAFLFAAASGGPNNMTCVNQQCQESQANCVYDYGPPGHCDGACFESDPFPCDYCVTSTGSNCNLQTRTRTIRWYHMNCSPYAGASACYCDVTTKRVQATYEVTSSDC